MGGIKPTIEYIKKSFENSGYVLLSTEYINSKTHLDFLCSNGHHHKIKWNDWYNGKRCRFCSPKHNIITYEKVKESFEKENYEILTKKYVDNKTFFECICSNGHRYKTNWGRWNRGHRCGSCYNPKPSYKDVKETFETEEYNLLSKKYINSHSYLYFICPKGHKHKIKWYHWKHGGRCAYCDREKTSSKQEREIVKYIKSIYSGRIIENDRTIIVNPKTGKYLELDVWLPEIKKAIEYNGIYWHSSEYVQYKDSVKKNYCVENEISLLVVSEEEWSQNRNFNLIKLFLKGQ